MENLEKYGFRKGFDWDNRFMIQTWVGKYIISTVDLGLNHQFNDDLPPLYYETMIFKKEKDVIDFRELYCERYTTEEEAKKGHDKAIEYVIENLLKHH